MLKESLIIAGQDQGLMTNEFKKMAGISTDDKCRFCHDKVESAKHLVSACQTLMADGWYTKGHDKICKYIHWKICKEYNIKVKDKIWKH